MVHYGNSSATVWDKRLAALLFEVTLTVILLAGCSPSAQDHEIVGDFNTSASNEPSVTHVHAALLEGKHRLEAAGFPPQLAEKLVAVNELLLRISYEEDQSEFDSILALLSRLGRHDHLHAQLEKFPELAGLCASALGVDPSGPALILASVPAVEAEQEVVYSMYSFFCDETDALRLARRLERYGQVMKALWLEDQIYVAPFLKPSYRPEVDEVDESYLTWVGQAYREALAAPAFDRQDELDRTTVIIMTHGEVIYHLMREEPSFREAFLHLYWPRHRELLRRKLYGVADADERELIWTEHYADPRVWKFIHDFTQQSGVDEAFRLLEQYGLVTVDIWLAPELKDPAIRYTILEALSLADLEMLAVLADPAIRSDPLFASLLRRKISKPTLVAAIRSLPADPDQRQRRLQYWSRLSNQALAEELGPGPEGPSTWLPGYQVYYLVRKFGQGREISGWDWALAVRDVAGVVRIIRIILGRAKLREIAKEIAGTLAEAAAIQRPSRAVEKAPGEASKQTIQKAVWPAVFRQSLSVARVDVTTWVRMTFRTFKKLGLGRKAFRNATGLESRILMRADRCVYLNFSALVSPSTPYGRVLSETASNALGDALPSSPGAQMAIRDTIQTAQHAWRQFLSAGWIAVGLDKLSTDNRGTNVEEDDEAASPLAAGEETP